MSSSRIPTTPNLHRLRRHQQQQDDDRSLHHSTATHTSSNSMWMMERVLFQLHRRFCAFLIRHSSGRMRRTWEQALLVAAMSGVGCLVLLHRSFVYSAASNNCASTCLGSLLPAVDPTVDVTHIIVMMEERDGTGYPTKSLQHFPDTSKYKRRKCRKQNKQCQAPELRQNHPDNEVVYSHSYTKAYLQLPFDHDLFAKGHVTNQFVYVSAHNPHCFGKDPFPHALLHGLSLDTVVLNWLLAWTTTADSAGYALHRPSNQLWNLETLLPDHHGGEMKSKSTSSSSTLSFRRNRRKDHSSYQRQPRRSVFWKNKLAVIVQTSFLFFFCTTLINFTLRETQQRMLEFTHELSHRVSVSLPLHHLVTTHVVSNLIFIPIMVGMMFVLIEFYAGDKVLAFLVMSLIWCVEVFTVVSLRSTQGIRFFPSVVFLLFFLFHVYYFAYPHGFTYTALMVIACFMFHSMVFFWHRYELPAVVLGKVTVDRPRMLATSTEPIASTSRIGTSNIRQHQQQQPQYHHRLEEDTNSHLLRRTTTVWQSQESLSTQSSRGNLSAVFRQYFDDSDEPQEDGDGSSSSAVYFLEGEVVLRRRGPDHHSTDNPMIQPRYNSTARANTTDASPHNNEVDDASIGLDTSSHLAVERTTTSLSPFAPFDTTYDHATTSAVTSTTDLPTPRRLCPRSDNVSSNNPRTHRVAPNPDTRNTPRLSTDATSASGIQK